MNRLLRFFGILAIGSTAKETGAAKALIAFLASSSTIPAITKSGLEPVGPKMRAN